MAPRLQFEDYLSALYVGSDLRNEAIEECIFIAKRGLSLKSECTSDILYWFLPLLQFITVTWESAVSNSFLLAIARSPTLLRFLGLSIHVCASTVLLRSSHLSRCNYDNSQYGRYVYALNPIIIFSCILSPVPSVLHLLIAVANYSSLIGYFIPLFTSLSLLVTAHSGFYSVIPAYFVLLNYSIREKGRKTTRDAKDYYNYSAKLFIAVSVIIAAAVMVHFSSANQCAFKEINPQYFFCLIKDFSSAVRRSLTSNMTANNQHSTIKYQPAAGVFWYFEAQLFSPFSEYFALLTFSQPFLFAVPLLVRFSSSRPLHTVKLFSS